MPDLEPIPMIPRNVLSEVFRGNIQMINQFEEIQRYVALTLPGSTNDALAVATEALTNVSAVQASPIVTYATAAALSAERVLTGGTGVTLDLSVAAIVKIVVDVITALGYTPANAAGQAFGGAISGPLGTFTMLQGGGILSIGNIEAATYEINDVATPDVVSTITDTIPIMTTSGPRKIMLTT